MANKGSSRVYKNIIFWGMLFTLTFLPVVYSTKSLDIVVLKTVLFRLALLFLLCVWFCKLVDMESIKLPKNPVILPLVIFISCSFISALFSLYKPISFSSFFSIFSYFLFFLLLIESIEERRQISLIVRAVLITASLVCFLSLYQSISLLRLNFWNQVIFFNFFGNPNFIATYLIAVAPLSFSLFIP